MIRRLLRALGSDPAPRWVRRLGPSGLAPAWVPALVLAPAGAGVGTPPLLTHRIFGRHKEAGPAGAGEPEGSEGPETGALDGGLPPLAGAPPEPVAEAAGAAEAAEPPAPEPPGAADVALPEWATRSLDGVEAGAESAQPEPAGAGDRSVQAGDPGEPRRGWRERVRGSRPEPEPEPVDAVGESESAEAPEPIAGFEEARLDWSSAPAAPEEPLGGSEPSPPDVTRPFEPSVVPEPPLPAVAPFGIPEDPTLLLRPQPIVPEAPSEPAVSALPEPSSAASEVPSVTDLTPTAPHQEPRAFPLPDGEVVFRNLRTAFTDPARLLRHLASDGHTGVLEIVSGESRSSYVVLLEGGVVAVALEDGGAVRTTSRVAFPAFPDGQDTLNVFRYPPEVARGLGLLLHAPVLWAGLGAVFVDLDGLNTYLQGRQAGGGLDVADGERIGVALYSGGELVGAYTSEDRSLGDLERIRALVAGSQAEIDVRVGGPTEPPAIPLDDLLRGLGG